MGPIKHWARTPALFQVPGSSVGSREGMIMTILTCWLVPTLLLACLLALTLCWALTSLLGSELVPWWAQQLVEHSEQGCVLESFQTMLCGGKISDRLRCPESQPRGFGLWVLAEVSAALRAQTHVGPACNQLSWYWLVPLAPLLNIELQQELQPKHCRKPQTFKRNKQSTSSSFLTAAS